MATAGTDVSGRNSLRWQHWRRQLIPELRWVVAIGPLAVLSLGIHYPSVLFLYIGLLALHIGALAVLATRRRRTLPDQHHPTAGTCRVAVVGAGPAGLVTRKELLAEGHEVHCFEATEAIGGVFQHTYATATLTSSPFVTAFSDFPPDETDHSHWTKQQYLAYLERYVDHFKLRNHIHLQTAISSASCEESDQWVLRTDAARPDALDRPFDHLVICTGLNTGVNLPTISGIETFQGARWHSGQYCDATPFVDQRVLLIGIGETAADISAEIADVARTCTLSTRSGAFVIPRVNPLTGRNNDYDTNRLRYAIPKPLHNASVRLGAWLDRLADPTSEAALRARILNIGHRVGPFNRFATKSNRFVQAIHRGKLSLSAPVARIDGDRVIFTDGREDRFDAIVACTGFGPGSMDVLRENGVDVPTLDKLFRYMLDPAYGTRLAFIGFARPCIGAAPPVAEMQARYFATLLSKRATLPDVDTMQRTIARTQLLARQDFRDHRSKTLVNWIAYMDTLANDIGCRPTWRHLIWRPRLLWRIVFGPMTGAYYRLAGPHSDLAGAEKILRRLPLGMRRRDLLWHGMLHLCVPLVLPFWFLSRLRRFPVSSVA